MCVRHMIVILIVLVLAACSLQETTHLSVTEIPTSAPLQTLDHTEWALTSLDGTAPVKGSAITLAFYPGSYLEGDAGCNSYGVDYIVGDHQFQVPQIHRTQDTCDAPDIMQQEAAFFAALSRVAAYRATEERLEFDNAQGRMTLAFARVHPPSTGSILPGTRWVLTSLRGQPVLPGTRVNLEFGKQTFSGFTGCNYYGGGPDSGKYAATDDGVLQLLEFAVTALGCPGEIMAQEKMYLEALASAATYRLSNRRLEIQNAAGETILVYAARAECAEEPASLAGTAWQLISVDGQAPLKGATATLGFVDDQWFVEHSRCQGYISSYQTIGHDLSSGFSEWLGQVCQDEGEQSITTVASPSDYCLTQGRLRITTRAGLVFVYDPLPETARPPLEGSTWSLLSIVGQRLLEGEPAPVPEPNPVREGSEITLALAGGIASGSAGCNTYEAAYTLAGTSLAFSDVAATERDCPTPEGVMEQEQRYLAALKDVTSHRMVASQLWLQADGGNALVFVVEEARPVIQATGTPILTNTPIPYPIPTPHPTETAYPTSTLYPTAIPYPTPELTYGGPYTPDEHTLLLLHFDDYYAGTQDEPGTALDTSFAEGRYGQGVLIDNADRLDYATAGSLNPEAGSIEFWVRPGWDGDDGQMHIFFETAPADYGIQIGKDGVGNLQFIIWTPTGVQGVGQSLLDWQAGEWYHLAAVWDTNGMAVFIDGQEADSNPAAIPPETLGAIFLVGASPDLGWQADAVIDELRISDVPRLGNGEGYPGRTASAHEGAAKAGWIELTGPLLVDSQAGRLYASGRVDQERKTLVLAAIDGRLLATYDTTGLLALDSVHGWLVVDRDDEGLAVLDAQTGALQASIPLPDRGVVDKAYARPGPAPQADPATGQVQAFRDNVVYVADPEKGLVTRTIPFDFPKVEDCRTLSGPLPIEWATYDSARRFLYLDFETYVCTPWIGHTLVSYDMESGSEIARGGVPPLFSATAFDGSLYGSSWFRMGDGYRWAWRDGRPWFESSGWSSGAGTFVVDPTRQRLYGLSAGGLHVFDARTMALIMTAPLPVDGQLLGYDPQTDQLYSHINGELRPWSPSAIQPPMPQPLSVSQPPTTSVRSLLVSPGWPQDKTLFGIWNAQDLLGTCWVFGEFGGPLYVSDDGGSTWSRPRGGLLDGCEDFSALAVSPEYARDRTLLAGVIGLGLFRSSDGGQLWEPSSAELPSMSIEQILLSPGFAQDGTAFARVAPAGGRRGVYRSRDGGRSWQALDMNLDLVAMSPEFDQDHTLMGVAVSYIDYEQHSELLISRDGGDHWERVGSTPAGKPVTSLSLAPLFARWHVLFAQGGDGTLYRSADGGSSWDAVLADLSATPTQLVYAPDIEVNRPVFLVAVETLPDQPAIMRGRLYRSGDGGLTWRELELPEDISPTALAISPNFAQDRLLLVGTADGRVLTLEN